MPVACPSCGAQNPDENAFCQNCGRPLAAPAGAPASAAPPAPAAPPPGEYPAPPPGGYAPGYAPGQPGAYGPPPGLPPGADGPPLPASAAPPHRLNWILVVGPIVGLLAAVVGVAKVVSAFVTPSPPPPPPPLPTPVLAPTPVGPRPTPALPTPAVSAQGTATVRPGNPTPIPRGGATAENKSLAVNLPTGWTVKNTGDFSIQLLPPKKDGLLILTSGPLKVSAQEYVQSIVADTQKDHPDVKVCQKPDQVDLQGMTGSLYSLCYTVTPQGGKAYQARDLYWQAFKGTTLYEFNAFADQSNDAFFSSVVPVVESVRWKLS